MSAGSTRPVGARGDEALAVAPCQRGPFVGGAFEHHAWAATEAGAATRQPGFHLGHAGGGTGNGPVALGTLAAGAGFPGPRAGFLECAPTAPRRHGCVVPVRPAD